MTKQEAIAELENTIAKIRSYISRVQQIVGSRRNAECNEYIGRANKYLSEYLTEISIYRNIADEVFYRNFPTYIFRNREKTLKSLESV